MRLVGFILYYTHLSASNFRKGNSDILTMISFVLYTILFYKFEDVFDVQFSRFMFFVTLSEGFLINCEINFEGHVIDS